jgi:hypothetical protein
MPDAPWGRVWHAAVLPPPAEPQGDKFADARPLLGVVYVFSSCLCLRAGADIHAGRSRARAIPSFSFIRSDHIPLSSVHLFRA